MKTIPCPNCGEPANAGTTNAWRPFCSRRCKLIDLGDWLTEEHHIPGKPEDSDWGDNNSTSQSQH